MERTEEILENSSDISYMKRHRNLLCGVPILEVGEVCDLLKIYDRQLRRYHELGLLSGFYFEIVSFEPGLGYLAAYLFCGGQWKEF